MHICMYVPNTGIAIIQCQGHKYSMEERDTTVINLEVHPDQATMYKAKNNPKVAALLHFLGVKKEQYRYQENKKPVSYTLTATDTEKPKYFIKKLAELLPGFFDDDDKELIYSTIDEKLTEAGQKKRQINECQNQISNTQPPGPQVPELQGPETTLTIITCIEIHIEDWIIIIKRRDTLEPCP